MQYISTRNKKIAISSSEAIVQGISKDGGLFVPQEIPTLSKEEFQSLQDMSYEERTAFVLHKFMDDFTYEELLGYATLAYSRFYDEEVCPLVKIDEITYILELWHGPTCAFKDMALTILPHLMTASRKKIGEVNKTLILVATSGDTGKAALEGFKDVEGCEIMVFYPSDGVSDMQRLQMITQEGENVHVCAIEGNFDDAQNAVKEIFADEQVKIKLANAGYKLSSANSINWGRLAPQIAYYVSSYVDMLAGNDIKFGEKINFCVPSGNFGNILAGYYAMKMGVPINKLICASNLNNILTDFFNNGIYDTNRDFYKTVSPSMDILISSNLERLLFELMGKNDGKITQIMLDLKEKGNYKLDKMELMKSAPEFYADFSDEESTLDCIDSFFDLNDYLLDTHTAVAMNVYNNYILNTHDEQTKTVVISTANPFKFPTDVYEALTGKQEEDSLKACLDLRRYTGEEIPQPLLNLDKRVVRFNDTIDKKDIREKVLSIIK